MHSPYPDDEALPLPPPPGEPASAPAFVITQRDAVVAMIVEDVRGGTQPNRVAPPLPPPTMRAADRQVRTTVHPYFAAPAPAAPLPEAMFLTPAPARQPAPAPLIRVRAASGYAEQFDKSPIKLALAFVLTSGCAAAGPLVVERNAVWNRTGGYYDVDLKVKGLAVQDAQQLLDADAAAHAERLHCAAPRTELAAASESTKPGKKKESDEGPAPPEDATLISGRLYCGGSGGVS